MVGVDPASFVSVIDPLEEHYVPEDPDELVVILPKTETEERVEDKDDEKEDEEPIENVEDHADSEMELEEYDNQED